MISHIEILRRLHKESAYWKKQLLTDFETGIIRGLQIAILIITEVKKDHDASVSQTWKLRRSAT